jgi:hypothetical protein
MPYVAVGKENSADIELYYEDHGSGDPVVGGPHAMNWTHAEEVNAELAGFLASGQTQGAA